MEEVPVDPEKEKNNWTFPSSQTMVLKVILKIYRKTTLNFFIHKKKITMNNISSKWLLLSLAELRAWAKSLQSKNISVMPTSM